MLDFAFPTPRHVAQTALRVSWRCLPLLLPLGLLALPSLWLTGMEPAFHQRWLSRVINLDVQDSQGAVALEMLLRLAGRPVSSFVAAFCELVGSALATVLLRGWLAGEPVSLLGACAQLTQRGTEVGTAAVLMGALHVFVQILYAGFCLLGMQRGADLATNVPMMLLCGAPWLMASELFIYANYSVVGPLVAKGVEGWRAFGASRGLCRGKRWRVLGAWLWTILFLGVPALAITLLIYRHGGPHASPGLLTTYGLLAMLLAPVRYILAALLLFDVRVAAINQASVDLKRAA